MNNAYTVDLFQEGSQVPVPATGHWNESYLRPLGIPWSLFRLAKVAGLVVSMAASSVTAVPDFWLIERWRRDRVVTISIYQEVIGRRISRFEALQIAAQILEQAERERLEFSEFEAARGIQWEDGE